MNKYLKEFILLAFVFLPYIYLFFIWNTLPEKVPTHFNFEGVADGWSEKPMLFFIPTGLGLLVYLLMFVLPFIDPKKKIQQMGNKYLSFRFMLVFFFSFLSIYFLYTSKEGGIKNTNLLIALMGVMFVVFGNYFQALRPNYFIGIRTPWTLENEQIWKKTHYLGGRLWMICGLLIIILSFIIHSNYVLGIISGILLFVMVVIPIGFSYLEYRREKNVQSL